MLIKTTIVLPLLVKQMRTKMTHFAFVWENIEDNFFSETFKSKSL